MDQRRTLLKTALQAAGWCAGGALGLLGGCGFALRSASVLPFERLMLEGVLPATSIGQELRRQLGARVRLVEPIANSP